MIRSVFLSLIALAAPAVLAQTCTTYVLVDPFNGKTGRGIDGLTAESFQALMGKTSLPVVSATRDFNNRVLVLVETDGANKNDKIEEVVDMVTRQTREADEGKPVAFGMFAEKALFTKAFLSTQEKRNAAMSEVIEEAGSLGKRVALWDALHQALGLFGPHQPGDTVLLIGEPYDDASHHSAESVEKEFIASGTRLFVMRRLRASRVERDFAWKSHDFEKTIIDRMTQETGGLWSEYVASLIRFARWNSKIIVRCTTGVSRICRFRHARFRSSSPGSI